MVPCFPHFVTSFQKAEVVHSLDLSQPNTNQIVCMTYKRKQGFAKLGARDLRAFDVKYLCTTVWFVTPINYGLDT